MRQIETSLMLFLSLSEDPWNLSGVFVISKYNYTPDECEYSFEHSFSFNLHCSWMVTFMSLVDFDNATICL